MKGIRFSPKVTTLTAKLGSIFGGGKKDEAVEGDRVVYERDDDGNALFREDVISKVMAELDKRKTERLPLEQQWTLNADFLVGNQYCDINFSRGEVEQLAPYYEWADREVFNNISTLIETRIANLKKINYMMKVKPATNELDDYAKANVSTDILQHTQKMRDFETKKNTMIYWNELCGNCFWLSWWNKDGGEEYAREIITIVDEDGVEQQKEKAYYQGDLEYGLITPYEVYPESIFKQGVESQRSIILEQVKSVDDIYDLYGIKVPGSSIETFELTPVSSGNGLGYVNTVMSMGHRTVEDCEKVVTYMERPTPHCPNGKMIIIVGEEHLVYYGDLPYNEIPLIQCVCHEVPGQFFGKSTIESLIPYQRALNNCVNRIHEYIKRVAFGNCAVEEGSLVDVEWFEENGLEPGAIVVYKNGYGPPTPMTIGHLPSEVMTERYNLKNDMEYVAGVSQLMVTGNTPSGVTSGKAISNLMDIDNTRLSLTGDHIRNSIRKLAILWLKIYKMYASTARVVDFVGKNDIGFAMVWSNNDINSYDVEYVTENELLMSEEMQKQRFMELYQMGMFADDNGQIPMRVKLRAIEYSKLGNYSEMMNLDLLQMQAAQRENSFFESGVIPEISEFDNHQIHEEEHMRYILQMDFKLMKHKKPEYAAMFEDHIRMHKQAVAQEQAQAMQQAMMMSGAPMM